MITKQYWHARETLNNAGCRLPGDMAVGRCLSTIAGRGAAGSVGRIFMVDPG
jgi:hypothetical protein